jgi:hypothetical protein
MEFWQYNAIYLLFMIQMISSQIIKLVNHDNTTTSFKKYEFFSINEVRMFLNHDKILIRFIFFLKKNDFNEFNFKIDGIFCFFFLNFK